MSKPLRPIAIVTGTRAEFGLLRPVMAAVEAHPALELLVIAAGAHLIPPAQTFRDVKKAFPVADSVPMQRPGPASRLDDAEALGRGVSRFARSFAGLRPDWVVVLGDRIEAFAAASAASIGGIPLAHIHGGDRAEGIADEAMRHAITKLAHLHLPATAQSAERIARMGEPSETIHVVGSPAVDDLAGFEPLDDDQWAELGSPAAVLMMHPIGRHPEEEEAAATAVIEGCLRRWHGSPTRAVSYGSESHAPKNPDDPENRSTESYGIGNWLWLAPNRDPGREGVVRAIDAAVERRAAHGSPSRATKSRATIAAAGHMPRERFIGLLKRLASTRGVLVGNSSAGLIEAAVLGVPTVNIGTRQAGRERAGNVIDAERENPEAVSQAIQLAQQLDLANPTHPYGDGHAGTRIAEVLASINPQDAGILRKHCAY